MNIFFSGIGGVGIGPLAEIAHDAGYSVQGSDLNESHTTRELAARGIHVHIGQDGAFLESTHTEQPIDWFVYTAALPDDHPELVRARDLGIKTAKRDELLAHIIAEKNLTLLAVAGTHGKTTTTGMLIWALKQQGIPVSYSVGSTLSWGPSGLYDPDSRYFVYECDEFDRNFLHFSPHLSLITSIEHDHPDTFPTEAEYMAAFSQFAAQSDRVIAWEGDAKHLTSSAHITVLPDDDIAPISLPGLHNRKNATLVKTALRELNLSDPTDDLERFPGTQRRFERLAENLYSDYGHTPTEISATLQMAHEISAHVALVYQPHQNVRQHEIRHQYTDEVFRYADTVLWVPTYLSREPKELTILSPHELTKQLNDTQYDVAELDDTLWQRITELRRDNYLVLCMGAGTIDGWVREQLER